MAIKEKKTMTCINNMTLEYCLTEGKLYDVELEKLKNGDIMYKVIDDCGDEMQTMIHRFQ